MGRALELIRLGCGIAFFLLMAVGGWWAGRK